MYANRALAPAATSQAYGYFGVHLMHNEGIVVWALADDQSDDRSEDQVLAAADEVITERGYKRTADWDTSIPQYAQAPVEWA